jgi:hypothetical protein
VFSGGDVVVMGTVGVTMLHPRGRGIQSFPLCLRPCHLNWRTPRGWCAKTVTAVHHTYEYGAWIIPLRRKIQVIEAVGGELQAVKAYGFSWCESNVGWVFAVRNEGESW